MLAAEAATPVEFQLETIKVDRLHTDLVNRGACWLKRKGCKLVLREFYAAQEIPDVIGWKSTFGHSFLIEAKTSRSDFLKDRKKPWRREPQLGMGQFRYMLCPVGMIKPAELPKGWGLLYAHPKIITLEVGKDPARYGESCEFTHHERNKRAEMQLLLSALNRIQLKYGVPAFDAMIHQTYESKR